MNFKAELKQVDDELKMMRLSVDRARDSIFWLSREGLILYVNDAACAERGYSREEMLGIKIYDLDPDYQPGVWGPHFEDLKRRGNIILETRHRTKDGHLYPIEVSANYVHIGDQEFNFCFLRDITERKRAEEEAQRSQKRLRDLIDGLGPSMFVGLMTLQGIVIECNRPALAAAGLKPEDVLGKPFEETYWWAYSQEVQQQLRQAIARAVRGESSRYDVQLRAAENHLIDVDFSLEPLRDETGEVVFLVPSANVITERKQTENALRASEEKFRGLFESSRDAIMTLEAPSWRSTSGNPATVKMFRAKNEEEFISLGAWARSPERQPDGRASAEQAREMIETALREGSHFFEWTHQRIGGEDFPANVLLTRMEQGGKVMLQATVRDITESKAAQRMITRLNRVYAMLSGINSLIVRVRDRDELFREACRIAVEAGGFRMAMIATVDRSTMKIVPVASADKDEALLTDVKRLLSSNEDAPNTMLAQAIREKKTVVSNDTQSDPRGLIGNKYTESGVRSMAVFPLIVSDEAVGVLALYASEIEFFHEEEMKLLTELADNVAFGIGNIRSRRKRLQADAKVREQSSILDKAQNAIEIRDLQHKVLYWNQGAERLYGWTAAEAVGRSVLGLMRDPADFARAMDQLLAAGEWVGELLQVDKDGSPLVAEGHWTLVHDDQGAPIHVLAINIDIRERKQAQEEILRLNASLEERVQQRTEQLEFANKQMESFAYSVSHDLRSPLNAIDGFSSLLERTVVKMESGPLTERSAHYLARIRAGVSQMGELIEGMLSLAQVSRASLLWETVAIGAIAEALLSRYQEREPGRATQLQVEAGLLAQGDPRLLKQVLDNLLGNAWKFSAGQVRTEIAVGHETGSTGETIYFVRDNGAGFDMAYADKLFGTFQRLHTQGEFAGTGIGLATVRRIIERHGGRIWGESEPGSGATFYFTLGTAML